MVRKAYLKVSLRTFNADLLDGLEKRVALFSQYIKKKYSETPVLSYKEWLEEYKCFNMNKEESSLEDLIKAFLANENT